MGVVGFLSVPKHFGIPSLFAFFPTSIPVKKTQACIVLHFLRLVFYFFSYICLCVSNPFNPAYHHFLPINWEMEKSYNHIGYIQLFGLFVYVCVCFFISWAFSCQLLIQRQTLWLFGRGVFRGYGDHAFLLCFIESLTTFVF